ncbi:MAG: glycosyltransferase family 92 protein [Rhodobacteraceae bacterium]|nr:glycosyltransferase family 92 protein [Paracoccaceae bacterium]
MTKIAIEPPAPLPGRRGLVVVLIVRNEGRHIAEWARFHRLAGVDHFVVYDNGCTDDTLEVLRRTLPDEALSVIPWNQKFRDGRSGREIHNQVLAYAHATRNFGGRFRWMSWIDVDEFLVPKTEGTLPLALAALEGCQAIALPWHMFGRNGHMTPPPGGVLGNYTRRNPDPMADGLRNFKYIADPCAVTALRVHCMETNGSSDCWNDAGRRFTLRQRDSAAFYSAARIQLNHYYTRSDAELRAKIVRGPNLTTPEADHLRRVMRKVAAIEAGEVEDRAAIDYVRRRSAGEWP